MYAQIVHHGGAAMHAPDPRLGSAAATPNRRHRPNRSHTATSGLPDENDALAVVAVDEHAIVVLREDDRQT